MEEDTEDENREIYLQAIRVVVSEFEVMLGKKTARKYARKAPIELNPEGEVKSLYGKGEDAFRLLVDQYEKVWGEQVALRKVRSAIDDEFVEEQIEEMPERYQPRSRGSILQTVMRKVGAR